MSLDEKILVGINYHLSLKMSLSLKIYFKIDNDDNIVDKISLNDENCSDTDSIDTLELLKRNLKIFWF